MSMRLQAGILLPGYDPLRVANAPTIGTASQASSTSVSVPFTAPSCVGGGAITSYTAYCTTTGTNTATGASSPLTVTGLTTGQAYTFRVFATNAYGPSYQSAASNSVTPVVQGQQAYTSAGTYTWIAPSGVTSVSVVAVGGGAGSSNSNQDSGGGGGLGYKNNVSVTPGGSYTVTVGAAGVNTIAPDGGDSWFSTISTVRGMGAVKKTGGGYVGDGGGNGGNGVTEAAGWIGGGGAGGYSGNGGSGTAGSGNTSFNSGSGGGGAGNSGQNYAGGGGVGILGQGASGSSAGAGGSGGSNNSGTTGGAYGGGAGYAASGGVGAVRIIWPGTTRFFPSTNTGDL